MGRGLMVMVTGAPSDDGPVNISHKSSEKGKFTCE